MSSMPKDEALRPIDVVVLALLEVDTVLAGHAASHALPHAVVLSA